METENREKKKQTSSRLSRPPLRRQTGERHSAGERGRAGAPAAHGRPVPTRPQPRDGGQRGAGGGGGCPVTAGRGRRESGPEAPPPKPRPGTLPQAGAARRQQRRLPRPSGRGWTGRYLEERGRPAAVGEQDVIGVGARLQRQETAAEADAATGTQTAQREALAQRRHLREPPPLARLGAARDPASGWGGTRWGGIARMRRCPGRRGTAETAEAARVFPGAAAPTEGAGQYRDCLVTVRCPVGAASRAASPEGFACCRLQRTWKYDAF